MATHYSPKIVTDGLMLALDAANPKSYSGAGTTWFDLSGNDHDATLYASTSWDASGHFILDGSLNYIKTNTFSVDLDGDPIFSNDMWIKRTSSFSGGGYWGIAGGEVLDGINGYTSPGSLNMIGIDLWATATFHTGIEYPLNEWVNVVWVKHSLLFNIDTIIIYINGIPYTGNSFTVNRGTSHTPSCNTSTKGVIFGRVGPNADNYYAPGLISISKIYNRALSAAEVNQNFEATRSRFGI